MVVVPEPAVKCSGAFAAGGVDRAVGPAVDQGADEAFSLSVCLWPVGAGAQVADAELAACERVQGASVAGAVVAEDCFDSYAVATVERDRTSEEGGRGDCFLVGSYFGVGEAAVVVDGD